MYCQKCGYENSNDNKFCLNCGEIIQPTDNGKIKKLQKDIIPKKKVPSLSKVLLFVLVAALVGSGAYFGTTLLIKSLKSSDKTVNIDKSSDEKHSNDFNGVSNTRGNTVGNITNGGYVAEQDGWIYYRNSSIDGKLCKIKMDDTVEMQLSQDKIEFINVIGNWVYYSNESDKGQIYKVKIDGTERTQLNDAKSRFLNVLDGWIYYVNVTDGSKIYKIKTDGTENTKINDNKSDYPVVLDGWIYYINKDSDSNVYKISINGTDSTMFIGSGGSSCLNASGGTLYYINDFGSLFAIGMDGIGLVRINDGGDVYGEYYKTFHTFNMDGSTIFFANMKLLSMDLGVMDVNNPAWDKMYNQEWVTRIHVIGDWIYFTDQVGSLSKIKKDGTEYMSVN